MHCPTCNKKFDSAKTDVNALPFCTKRCKQVDLGRWLLDDYRIAGPSIAEAKEEENYDDE